MSVCHWCYEKVKWGRKFCSPECRARLKLELETARGWYEPPQGKKHYLEEWAWQTKRVRQLGLPGDIGHFVCGWQRRIFKHQ